jgi:hypothetical protein
LAVESVGDPSHGALPVDELGLEVVDVEFVEERGSSLVQNSTSAPLATNTFGAILGVVV